MVLGASEYAKVRGNFSCCLAIFVIFAGTQGAKRSGGFKVTIRGKEESQKHEEILWGAIMS